MSGAYWTASFVTAWLASRAGARRREIIPKVVPLTMHDVAEQRRAIYGNTDRTPCTCPACRRGRNEAA